MNDQAHNNCLPYLLKKSAISLGRNLTKKFKEKGHKLTLQEFVVMMQLWVMEGQTQQELGEKDFLEKYTITRIVNKLEEQNLVIRIADSRDGRIKRIHLTNKGKDLHQLSLVCAEENIQEALTGVNENELEQCRGVLTKIIENIGAYEE